MLWPSICALSQDLSSLWSFCGVPEFPCPSTPGASDGKNVPPVQETWVLSLEREDPLEEGMAIHSSILPWRIPWTEEPGGL